MALPLKFERDCKMPELKSPAVYKAAFDATYDLLSASPAEMGSNPDITLTLPMGSPLYRYSSSKFSDGSERDVRKVHAPLARDKWNRWTGSDGGAGGVQGLYMGLEASGGADTEFSELYHYLPSEEGVPMSVVMFDQFTKANGKPTAEFAAKLHYMFLYFTKKQRAGINLDLPGPAAATAPFMTRLFMKIAGNAALGGMTPSHWYNHPEDASFCRGVGNACLSDHRFDFIRVTSARNVATKNLVLICAGGPDTPPVDYLDCQGRSTFFMNAAGTIQGEVTRADMAFNTKL